MSSRKARKGCLTLFVFLLLAAGGSYAWYSQGLTPLPKGEPQFIRFESGQSATQVFERLQNEKVIRNATALRIYGMVNKKPAFIKSGTYQVSPGMSSEQVFDALKVPIRQMVRLPETNWAKRSANLLERDHVTSAEDYMALFNQPERFAKDVDFPLPATTLEGFLYPDTYDLPPLLGAEGVIRRQLSAFEQKVMPHIKDPKKLYRTLIVASLVELETALDRERPIVAGVIENRLKKDMRLEIDACINYALQEWRPLTRRDLKEVDSPYNTYRNKGLPPTPICSPSLKSIQAALNPAKHNYLFYVALPNKTQLFSATYKEHLKNIAKRKAAIAALNP